MIRNRLVAYLFANLYAKIKTPIKNETNYLMPLDTILDNKQEILFEIVIKELNKCLRMFKQIN
uniref:Uncharacterized protein n=1 Tax=Porphyridium sordidum TaxID=28024 RepID=A0A1C9CE35_PORSO|nr:hypothetical protein Psor_160 [Porphyridium sordidum]AOM66635.1 hypothetical protein Psor_160 [Porphyridium sordidum]